MTISDNRVGPREPKVEDEFGYFALSELLSIRGRWANPSSAMCTSRISLTVGEEEVPTGSAAEAS